MSVRLPHDFKPRLYQQRLMGYFDGGGKRAAGVWHRRAGKDLTMLNEECKLAHERKGVYWHCLPTYRQAKKAIWDGFTSGGKRILDTVFPPSIVKRKNESEMMIELKCGSIIQLVGSDTIDNLVGAGPIFVTFSEYSLSRPNSWDLVRPMLQENGGGAAFIFTPRGNNHAKKLFDVSQKSKGWYSEKLTIYDTQALPIAVLEEERASGMPEALVRQEYLCDFTAALIGSVYGDLMEGLEKGGHIVDFGHDIDKVNVSFDLGIGDATAMWFWRVNERGSVDFIDHHEAHSKPLSYFMDEMEGRGYRYEKIFLPHDARARTLQTGVSTLDLFRERYGSKVEIVPSLSLADGLQAGRWLLQQQPRFNVRCGDGLEALKQYHYEYDADSRSYGRKPEHDWSSHTADAFRYTAIVARVVMRIQAKPVVVVPKPMAVPASYSFSLDELFEAEERSRSRRSRI